jgi:superfamily II DNA helicase RecQ
MNDDLLQKLKVWRQNMVNIEKVEPFRIFTNKTLENIAEIKPSNREELMAIKGIKDRKLQNMEKRFYL